VNFVRFAVLPKEINEFRKPLLTIRKKRDKIRDNEEISG
jgi:hypothetical protein